MITVINCTAWVLRRRDNILRGVASIYTNRFVGLIVVWRYPEVFSTCQNCSVSLPFDTRSPSPDRERTRGVSIYIASELQFVSGWRQSLGQHTHRQLEVQITFIYTIYSISPEIFVPRYNNNNRIHRYWQHLILHNITGHTQINIRNVCTKGQTPE